MTERQPVGGLPLVAYVTALIAIPIAGLIVLGGREVAANDAAARDARIVAETIENQRPPSRYSPHSRSNASSRSAPRV